MLFLTRKIGESVVINEDITLTICDIGTSHVKLSFKYPQGTRVLRQEVYNRIQEENKIAASQTQKIRSLLQVKKEFKSLDFKKDPVILFHTTDDKK